MLRIDENEIEISGDFGEVMGQLESLSIRVLQVVSEESGIPLDVIRDKLAEEIKKETEDDERNN